MNGMSWKVDTQSGVQRVVITGAITEESDFEPLAALKGGDVLHLDLAGVLQINSCGVREWIHFVRRLGDSAGGFELERCSPAIVRQLNMISNFHGSGAVRSVMLPYYCSACQREELRPFDLPQAGPAGRIEEVLPCPECGGELEFDDLPGSYVAFAA